MLSPIYEERLSDLLTAWRVHHDVRRSRPSIPALAESRRRLDVSRDKAYRARRALSPGPDEAAEAMTTTNCETLDETVFLYAYDALSDGRYRCLCGAVVPARLDSV